MIDQSLHQEHCRIGQLRRSSAGSTPRKPESLPATLHRMAETKDETFTRTQLQQLWSESLRNEPFPSDLSDVPSPHRIRCAYLRLQAGIEPAVREEETRALHARLMEAAGHPQDHFSRIDAEFSAGFYIRAHDTLVYGSTSHPVDGAAQVLQRLPSRPPELSLYYPVWKRLWSNFETLSHYFEEPIPSEEDQHSAPLHGLWSKLQVATRFSTVTLKLALLLVSCPKDAFNIASYIRRVLNLMSELLDISTTPKEAWSLDHALRTNIVETYVWANWTRCSLLFFWYILGRKLEYGYDDEWEQLLALRGTRTFMDPKIRAMFYGWKNERVPYMCSWAFELLKSDRAGSLLDFRHFHKRFADLHSRRKQRCQWDSDDPCHGGHPLSCGRFLDKRLVADEQSVHGLHQGAPCTRLVWSRESYVSVRGPVAVSTRTKAGVVLYTQSSASTMAISHVWSHGHGGRPDTGMNMCLHARFSRIAERHGCDSYWIDTLCIPDEHLLRKEAIGYINWIFAESKIVLVLDRDIMDIDASQPTIPVLESMLATFLVCDWNVRAWTMLEALKGSHNLQLLCLNETTLSLRDSLILLQREGRLDLTALILAARHLMPSSTDAFRRASSRKSIESAGSLLSHRHATRPGDDIVIWSLISNINVFFNAEEMWKGLVGRKVRTAFLMSTSPRLSNVHGFSWAPETPYIRQASEGAAKFLGPFLVHEGSGSEVGLITSRGLQGDWKVYRLDPSDDELFKDGPTTFITITDDGERKENVIESSRIRNRCWERAMELFGHHSEVALIQPVTLGLKIGGSFSSGRGESHGTVFAICVSGDGTRWHWEGVDSWPQSIKLPVTEQDTILIV